MQKGSICLKLTGKNNPAYRHGMIKTNTYKIWAGMLSSCYNQKVRIFKYYGGRGITVCDEWKDFINFYNDMGERPPTLELDRIDNEKGYSKDNCRWATRKENHPAIKGDLKDTMAFSKHNKWSVFERVNHKPGHRYYRCVCECGFQAIKSGSDIRRGVKECRNCKNISHRGWPMRRNID